MPEKEINMECNACKEKADLIVERHWNVNCCIYCGSDNIITTFLRNIQTGGDNVH